MGKFPRILTKKEQESLFVEFAQALSSLHSTVEMAHFIKDLLSEPETVMLARRLQIAKLLYQGLTYREIKDILKVSYGTIARVHTWMDIYGEGYRTVLERTKKNQTESNDLASWRKVQRKYPMYFWPQLLLEEIVRSANTKQRKRLQDILNQLHEKAALNKELEQLLRKSNL